MPAPGSRKQQKSGVGDRGQSRLLSFPKEETEGGRREPSVSPQSSARGEPPRSSAPGEQGGCQPWWRRGAVGGLRPRGTSQQQSPSQQRWRDASIPETGDLTNVNSAIEVKVREGLAHSQALPYTSKSWLTGEWQSSLSLMGRCRDNETNPRSGTYYGGMTV